MVDPKMVELTAYADIPHMLIPVVTDPKKTSAALNWAVQEMTVRYEKFAALGVRDIKSYNKKIAGLKHNEDNTLSLIHIFMRTRRKKAYIISMVHV